MGPQAKRSKFIMKGKSVSEATFKRYLVENRISYKVKDGQVTWVYCKLYAKYEDKIINHTSVNGAISTDVLCYITGIEYVTRHYHTSFRKINSKCIIIELL